MPNKELIKFIIEARKRGFDDYQIKEPLLKEGWKVDEIEDAFASLKPKYKYKNKISLFLDNELLKMIEKRAKKNMFTISEQIEDIIRRSCLNSKKTKKEEQKLDDMLVSLFSRRQYGKDKKSK
ncbi:MAG: hypothetical protein Q7S33_04845 [Nanoarchaeota archaeon]|nr:hypothetical protein [Nanoarchaeota archaeon]